MSARASHGSRRGLAGLPVGLVTLLVWLLLPLLSGCGDDAAAPDGGTSPDGAASVYLRGSVQKGPYILGSIIQADVLLPDLTPSGDVYLSFIRNDRGEFEIPIAATGIVSLRGGGYYYNEVTGQLSRASLSLKALYQPSGSGIQTAQVNLVTHLTVERIRTLVAGGAPFADAVTQAETELLEQLAITVPGYAPAERGIDLDLLGGDTDDNAYLLAVGSVMIQTAADRGPSLEANLQELLNIVSLDFRDGVLDPELRAKIHRALLRIDVADITTKLAARLLELEGGGTAPDMNRILDQDRDGIVNLDDNCVLVANPDQSDRDGDGTGDVCDECPDTDCPHDCLPPGTTPLNETGLCYRACDGTEGSCDEDEFCTTSLYTDATGIEHPIQLCTPSCTSLFFSSCPAGTACVDTSDCPANQNEWPVDVPCAVERQCVPVALRGTRGEGEACEKYEECGEGLVCEWMRHTVTGGMLGSYLCRRLCDRSQSPPCDGEPCEEGATISVCPLPEGQPGDVCAPSQADGLDVDPQGNCADGLLCALNIGGACAAGMNECCVVAGVPDAPCHPDQTCDASDVLCLWDTQRSCGADNCCVAAGELNQPCLPTSHSETSWQGCKTPDLACSFDQTRCAAVGVDTGSCCLPGGELGDPCDGFYMQGPTFNCRSDLVCSPYRAPCAGTACCHEPWPLYQACERVPNSFPCGASARCTYATDPALCGGAAPCCMPAGHVLEVCYQGDLCETDLVCVDQICVQGWAQDCGVTACPSGYVCRDSQSCVETGILGHPCQPPGDTCDSTDLECRGPQVGERCVYGDCCLPKGGT